MAGHRASSLVWVAALLTVAVAGCVTTPTTTEPPGPGPGPVEAGPVEVRFHDIQLPEGGATIAGLWWAADNATTAIVLVHGFSGVKENFFHTLPEAGYDLGAELSASGRAVLAIDLPSYGQSGGIDTDGGHEAGYGMDVHSNVLDQIAGRLRADRFDHIIGIGVSMGGITVDVNAGLDHSFDAIVPISAPHAGFRQEYLACQLTSDDPACAPYVSPQDDFWLDNADASVVAAAIAGYESQHDGNLASMLAWLPPCATPVCPPTRYDINAQSTDVPVLSILGDRDRIFHTEAAAGEPDFFPASPDARALVLQDTGHMAHLHENHDEVVAAIEAWLDDLGM